MTQTDFDKLMDDVEELVEPMEPVNWSLLITLPDEAHNALKKLVNYHGKGVAIHFNQKGRIFLFKKKRV